MTEKNKKGIRPSQQHLREEITRDDIEAAKAARIKAAIEAAGVATSNGNPFA